MHPIRIVVSVSFSTAIRAGSASAGRAAVALTDQQLQQFDAEERELLSRSLVPAPDFGHETYGFRCHTGYGTLAMPSPDFSDDAVFAVLRAFLAEERDMERAVERANAEAERAVLVNIVERARELRVTEVSNARPWQAFEVAWFGRDESAALVAAVKAEIPGAEEARAHLDKLRAEAAKLCVLACEAEADRYRRLPVQDRLVEVHPRLWHAVSPRGCDGNAEEVGLRYGETTRAAFLEAVAEAEVKTDAAAAVWASALVGRMRAGQS